MGCDVDIGLVADPRWGGGTTTALLNEIKAYRAAGLSCAFVFAEAPVLARSRPPHPGFLEALARQEIPLLPAGMTCRARLAVVHHPAVCQVPPARRFPLAAGQVALVAHHPAVERDGCIAYDYERACSVLAEQFGKPVRVLPVGPAVRRSLRLAAPGTELSEDDWPNLLDLSDWPLRVPQAEPRGPLVVGRHSRPDPLKWPDPEVAAKVFPARPDLTFLMLGVDGAVRALFDPWPGHWQGLPFRPGAAKAFLSGLDAYAYYHSSRWTEAFGYSVLEALASGLPTLVPPAMAETFGDGPLYAEPEAAGAIYDRLVGDPAFRAAAGVAARRAAERFDILSAAPRIARLLGSGPGARRRLRRPDRPDTALVVTSNGVGAGHVMRQIAIAEAAPIDQRHVFFTLSEAAGFAARAGFLVETRPFHRRLRLDPDQWNDWFGTQILEAVQFYAPEVVVFDGNLPYRGLTDAIGSVSGLTAVWVRRGMWRSASPEAADRSAAFDLILQPGEVAGAADPGLAGLDSAASVEVPPILPCPPRRRLSREIARRLLCLPEEGFVVLLALGSGRNYDMSAARQRTLAAFSDAVVVEPVNPVAPAPPAPEGKWHLQRQIFPLARYLAAFDAAVVAAGYNTFHEVMAAALPTLFVPNTAPEMDLQEVRAEHAARNGWALSARAEDPYAQARYLAALRSDEVRQNLRRGAGTIDSAWDGAGHAASLIALTARRHRAVVA